MRVHIFYDGCKKSFSSQDCLIWWERVSTYVDKMVSLPLSKSTKKFWCKRCFSVYCTDFDEVEGCSDIVLLIRVMMQNLKIQERGKRHTKAVKSEQLKLMTFWWLTVYISIHRNGFVVIFLDPWSFFSPVARSPSTSPVPHVRCWCGSRIGVHTSWSDLKTQDNPKAFCVVMGEVVLGFWLITKWFVFS